MTTAPSENAPWYLGRKFPPLGLSYVAAALEKAGFEVQVLDNYLLKKPIDEVKQLVKQLNPEIVGMTCSSSTYNKCVETAAAVKEVAPSCKVVVGGWHPSYVPDSMLQHPQIDYVVMGEGEQAMVELATYIIKGEREIVLGAIAGVAYKMGGTILKNTPKFIKNLDEIPFPARHLLPMDLYERKMEFLDVEPVDIMSIIRGCPFNCAFCETRKMWGPACRFFSPKRVVEEIKYMKDKYGSKGIYFINDNFTIFNFTFKVACCAVSAVKVYAGHMVRPLGKFSSNGTNTIVHRHCSFASSSLLSNSVTSKARGRSICTGVRNHSRSNIMRIFCCRVTVCADFRIH